MGNVQTRGIISSSPAGDAHHSTTPKLPYSVDGQERGLPIHRLPPEILEDIFRRYTASDRRLHDLVRLTLVCKRWRLIAEDASFLWGTISASEEHAMVRRALEMARDAPLDLTFNEMAFKTSQRTFFKSVGERIVHWRSLAVILNSPYWDVVLRDLEWKVTPNLEVLRLHGAPGGEKNRHPVTLFGGSSGPSRLKEFSLAWIPVNLSMLRLSGLKSLSLEAILGVSSADILRFLVDSPLLETIRLEYLNSLTGSFPPQHASSYAGDLSIQLSYLTRLSLFDLPVSFVNLVLSVIAAPLLHTLEVQCEIVERPAAQLLSVGMRHQIPTLGTMVSDAQTFEVTVVSRGHYQIIIGGLNVTLTMDEFNLNHFQETFDWLSDHLGRPLKDLPLHLNLQNCEPEPSFLEWFTRRTTVTKLSLWSDPYFGTPLERIVPFLSRPTTSTPVTWLVPRAEILVTNLVLDRGNPNMAEMIEKREAGRHDLAVVAPKPFREIWLSYGGKENSDINTDFLKDVQKAAQSADVYWAGKKWGEH